MASQFLSGLSADLVPEILALLSWADRLKMRAVCTAWRRALIRPLSAALGAEWRGSKPRPLLCGLFGSGALDSQRWLREEGLSEWTDADARAYGNSALRLLCSGGRPGSLDTARWFAERFCPTFAREVGVRCLRAICHRGVLEEAQWAVETFGLMSDDVRSQNNLALRFACFAGNLQVAEWIAERFGLSADDARAQGHYALRHALFHKHWSLAEWLVRRFGFDAEEVLGLPDVADRPKLAAKVERFYRERA